METKKLLERRAIDLTAQELAQVLLHELDLNHKTEPPSYTYKGIKGIMEIFQCSKSKAMAMRSSGCLDDACVEYGNSFLVDRMLALSLMKEKRNASLYYSK